MFNEQHIYVNLVTYVLTFIFREGEMKSYKRLVWVFIGCLLMVCVLMIKPFSAGAAMRGGEKEFITNAQCLECHDDIDAAAYLKSAHGAISCFSCHFDVIDIEKHQEVGARVHNEVATCDRCHAIVGKDYAMSTHIANEVKCADCHSEIHSVTRWLGDKRLSNQKCENCHDEVAEKYEEGVHGSAVMAGNQDSASCSDCHGLHDTRSLLETPERTEFHTGVCQKCHGDEEMMKRNDVLPIAWETYHTSYHGKVKDLEYDKAKGYPALVAGCVDCHSYHDILPSSNPEASTSQANLTKTCGKCHPGANANFVKWYVHADHHDKEHYPILFWAFRAMTGLLCAVFAVFWIHCALWWYRSYKDGYERRARGEHVEHHVENPAETYRRFGPLGIIVHFVMMTTFLLLVLTGMPLKFSFCPGARWLIQLFGGAPMAGYIHRVCAAITFGYFGVICLYIVYFLFFKKGVEGNWVKRLFGPDSLCPNLKDGQDIVGMFKWFVGKGSMPRFERWTYWEKFDFLAVFWGMLAIGLTGLMLWLPGFFSRLLPGWVFNVATIVHSDEALLAAGFIFTVHFFNTHFRPGKFPYDGVIFTGRLSKEELVEERPEQYDRYLKEGKLEGLKTKYPSLFADFLGRVLGFAGIVVGIICILLIIRALILCGI